MRMLATLTGIVICSALVGVLLWPNAKPQVGQWYVIEGQDSAAVEHLVDSDSNASPFARTIVHDWLAGQSLIRVDKTGDCRRLVAHYKGGNSQLRNAEDLLVRAFLMTRPVALFDSSAKQCFAYRMTYNVPLDPPVTWYDRQLTEAPMHFALIRSQEDFNQLRHANSR